MRHRPILRLPTAALLLALAACSNDPRRNLVGDWGLDLAEVEAEVEKAKEQSVMAHFAARARLEQMSRIKVAFTADGKTTMQGTGLEGTGSYQIDKVDGDQLTLQIRMPKLPPLPMVFTVHSRRRMTMTTPDRVQTLKLVRR